MLLYTDGYLDGVLRGYRGELLSTVHYSSFIQCESIDDLRSQLESTPAISALKGPSAGGAHGVKPRELEAGMRARFVEQFRYLHGNAEGKLRQFLDFVTYSYMIDNVILMVSGSLLHGYTKDELLEQCHPLGMFDSLPALTVATSADDIYHTVLAESPLGIYFTACLSPEDLDELHVEVIRGALHRAYLEHFHSWIAEELPSEQGMLDILAFEADRRVISIVLTSLLLSEGDGPLSPELKLRSFPRVGRLWQTGASARLAAVQDMSSFMQVLQECTPEYRLLFADDDYAGSDGYGKSPLSEDEDAIGSAEGRSLEDRLSEREVRMSLHAFSFQFSYAPFYAWCRLREQEIRNVKWIAECIAQRQRQFIGNYIPTDGS